MLRGPHARASAADRTHILFSVRIMAAIGSSSTLLCKSIPKLHMHLGKGWCWRTETHCRWPPQSSHRRASGHPVFNGRGRSVHCVQCTERKSVEWFRSQGCWFCQSSNYLEGRLFTAKKVHYQMVEAHNPRNKVLRLEYIQQISTHMLQNKTIIWMDETNIDLYCQCTQGRAPAGQRAVVALPGSKGPNVHVIGTITNFQVVKWSRLQGAFRSQSAKDWLADMLQHLPQGSTSTYK